MDEKECIKTCSEIYKLSQQAAQTIKNQGISSDFIINNLEQQLRTVTEKLSIAMEALESIKSLRGYGLDNEYLKNFINQALAKIEEVK